MRVALVQMPPCPRDTPPCEVALSAALLRRDGHEVRVFDVNNELFHETFKQRPYWRFPLTAHSEDPHAAIFREAGDKYLGYAQDILDWRPEAVVLKAEYAYHNSVMMAGVLKARAPSVPVLGSGFVSTDRPFLARLKAEQDQTNAQGRRIVPFDCLIVGEDDLALPEALKALTRGRLEELGGGFAAEGRVVDVGAGPWLEDLDSLPHYDFSDFDFRRYSDPKTIRFMVSRSCPWRCAYCRDWVSGGRFRTMSGDRWFEEYRVQHERNAGVRHLRYCDRLINGDMEALDRFCEKVVAAYPEAPLYWGADFVLRPELTDEMVAKLARAGCNNMGTGLESGSARVRSAMRKGGFSNELAERVFAACRRNRINVSVNVMIGFPTETREEFEETVRFIERNASNIWEARLTAPTTQITPGTALSEQPQAFGLRDAEVERWSVADGSSDYPERVRRFEEFCLRMLSLPGMRLAVNRRVIRGREAVERMVAECGVAGGSP